MYRLDRNLFHDGLVKLQGKVDKRFYTTTLPLARDISEVINIGIYTQPQPQPDAQIPIVGLAPPKNDFSDIRDRKRLGKRILKAVQSQLEAALHLEADISHISFDILRQELERIVEAGLEPRQADHIAASREGEQSQEVIMVGPAAAEITVGGADDGADDGADAADAEGVVADPMMVDSEEQGLLSSANIEVRNSDGEVAAKVEAVSFSEDTTTDIKQGTLSQKPHGAPVNGVGPLDTPPASNGFEASSSRLPQPGPPTPPQSNGSLGHQPSDTLTEGGIPWYLRDFEPEGTSAVQDQWPGRDAVRSLSEELTDLDEDELKGLGVEINEDSITATASKTEGGDDVPRELTSTNTSPVKKTAKSKRRRTTTYTRRR